MTALTSGLYKATVSGLDRVGLVDKYGGFTYLAHRTLRSTGYEAVSHARPLIVLDLHETVAEDLVVAMRAMSESALLTPYQGTLIRKVASQVEAQTKPPRIPEPGLWGVVEASREHDTQRRQWVRGGLGCAMHTWADLIDPTLIRDGIDS